VTSTRRRLTLRAATALAFGLLAALPAARSALAQSKSNIKFIVPLAPGGPNDTTARLMADEIGKAQGVNMIVENRPGAGTVIGTEVVARAAPDGATILMSAGSFIVNSTVKKLDYDPLTSFEHICYLVESPQVIAVPASSPLKTIGDLLKAAKEKPGALTLAANGPATAPHIEFEMFKHAAGVDMTFVPFPGDAPSLNALLGEQVSAALFDYATAAPQLAAGKLRVLVVGTEKRLPGLPDVPTIGEAGYKDLEWVGTLGVVAPAKTSKKDMDQLIGWFTAALKNPELEKKLANLGLFPKGLCGADYTAFLKKQMAQFQRGVKEANIKAE
jgi:tripartite-type tricarboxylate transporter receptor subunit TctC